MTERSREAATEPVRVLVVDDDPLVRAGLRMILRGLPEVAVVGEAADGAEVASAVDSCAPDVVLMDIRMPGLDGLAAVELLRARPNPPEVIVLTTFHTDEYVLRALRAGASGFLLKDTPPADILRAISRVAAGEPILSAPVIRQLIARLDNAGASSRRHHAQTVLARLSDREREVAAAVGQGKTSAEIGSELFMSVATVKAHVSHTLSKLTSTGRYRPWSRHGRPAGPPGPHPRSAIGTPSSTCSTRQASRARSSGFLASSSRKPIAYFSATAS